MFHEVFRKLGPSGVRARKRWKGGVACITSRPRDGGGDGRRSVAESSTSGQWDAIKNPACLMFEIVDGVTHHGADGVRPEVNQWHALPSGTTRAMSEAIRTMQRMFIEAVGRIGRANIP